MLAIPAFQARTQTALFRANNKPPLEVVVANLRKDMRQSFECCGKKIIGKPCEGEPHARFDATGDGNGNYRAIA